MTSLKVTSALALAASALLVSAASAAPAFAATTTTYGTWSEVTDVTTSQNYTGSVSFGTSGIPDATYETTFPSANANNEVTVRDNSGEWMSPQTPFGVAFGASGPSDTLNFLRVDAFDTNQTVITFDSPVPADRLGLAIGDLDFDSATITATDGNNVALTAAQLVGSSTSNVFNLCTVTDSVPTVCQSGGPYTEFPVLSTGANNITFDPNTVGEDVGVTGWLSPSAEVKTLTIEHTSQTGGSSLRYWLSAFNAPAEVEPLLANTAAPESGLTLWVAAALGLLGIGGIVTAGRRKARA